MSTVARTVATAREGSISRRRALKLPASLAAVLALGSTLPSLAPGAPAVPSERVIVVNASDLATASRERLAAYQAATTERQALETTLLATLTPDQQALYAQVEEAGTFVDTLHVDVFVAELARHLPGVAPALQLVWDQHILAQDFDDVGRCCGGREPVA